MPEALIFFAQKEANMHKLNSAFDRNGNEVRLYYNVSEGMYEICSRRNATYFRTEMSIDNKQMAIDAFRKRIRQA